MAIQYAHTFLFACPSCDLPVSITRVSGEQSRQSAGRAPMRTICPYCGKHCHCSPDTARCHYVEEWQRAMEAGRP